MASENILKQKEEEVSKLAEKLKEAKIILLTDYRGINVADVTKLRADLRNTNSEYKVIKNNIIKRALDANGESGLDDLLEGPTAIVIGTEDYLEPSKVIYNFSKNNEFYKIKGGIIEGKVMTAEEIITLAKLPSRQELMAKLAGALLGNITKLAGALFAGWEKKNKTPKKKTPACPISFSPWAEQGRTLFSSLIPRAGHRPCWEMEPSKAISTPCRRPQTRESLSPCLPLSL